MPEIKAWRIVQGPHWPESMEIKLLEEFAGYVRLAGSTTHSRQLMGEPIPRRELARLEVSTKPFNLGTEFPKGKGLYNVRPLYVKKQYHKALICDRRRSVAFALFILQRRLASSTYPFYRSVDEEVYNKLRFNGEVPEWVVPLVSKERYLGDQGVRADATVNPGGAEDARGDTGAAGK